MRSALVALTLLLAGPVLAHTIEPREVDAYLNADRTREECGIARARQIGERSDLLLIEVNDRWSRLAVSRSQRLAVEWRDMWLHAVKNGRVSIVDEKTQAPVVRYLPDGSVVVVGGSHV